MQSEICPKNKRFQFLLCCILLLCAVQALFSQAKTGVFIRVKVINPTVGEKYRVSVGGFRHEDPWYFPEKQIEATKDAWSQWVDLSDWKWHKKLNRAGGIAEWSSVRLTATRLDAGEPLKTIVFAVELADAPGEKSVVVSFTEKSESTIAAFLALKDGLLPKQIRPLSKPIYWKPQMVRRLCWQITYISRLLHCKLA